MCGDPTMKNSILRVICRPFLIVISTTPTGFKLSGVFFLNTKGIRKKRKLQFSIGPYVKPLTKLSAVGLRLFHLALCGHF
jgi:hypothetical protein